MTYEGKIVLQTKKMARLMLRGKTCQMLYIASLLNSFIVMRKNCHLMPASLKEYERLSPCPSPSGRPLNFCTFIYAQRKKIRSMDM